MKKNFLSAASSPQRPSKKTHKVTIVKKIRKKSVFAPRNDNGNNDQDNRDLDN